MPDQMQLAEAYVDLTTRSTKLDAGLNSALGKTRAFAAKATAGISSIGSSLLALAGPVAGAVAGAVAVGTAFKEMADAQEAAILLRTNLDILGQGGEEVARKLEGVADQIEKTYGMDAQDTIKAMVRAMQTGVPVDMIDGLTSAALGLSQVLGTDLATGMEAMSKAVQGDFMMLQRQIPTLKSMTSASEKLAEVQRVAALGLQSRDATQNSFWTLLQKLQRQVENELQGVGEKLAPVFGFVGTSLSKIIAIAGNAVDALAGLGGGRITGAFKAMGDWALWTLDRIIDLQDGAGAVFHSLERQATKLYRGLDWVASSLSGRDFNAKAWDEQIALMEREQGAAKAARDEARRRAEVEKPGVALAQEKLGLVKETAEEQRKLNMETKSGADIWKEAQRQAIAGQEATLAKMHAERYRKEREARERDERNGAPRTELRDRAWHEKRLPYLQDRIEQFSSMFDRTGDPVAKRELDKAMADYNRSQKITKYGSVAAADAAIAQAGEAGAAPGRIAAELARGELRQKHDAARADEAALLRTITGADGKALPGLEKQYGNWQDEFRANEDARLAQANQLREAMEMDSVLRQASIGLQAAPHAAAEERRLNSPVNVTEEQMGLSRKGLEALLKITGQFLPELIRRTGGAVYAE